MKKLIALVLITITILCFFTSCGILDKHFPLAEAITCPKTDNISEMYVYAGHDYSSKIYIEDDAKRTQIVEVILRSEPTRKWSVNDSPYTDEYYSIVIYEGENSHHYYVYKDGNKTYLEVPYLGVYRTDKALFEIVKEYFN